MIWTPSTSTSLQRQWEVVLRASSRMQAKAEGLIAGIAYQLGNLAARARTILAWLDWRGLHGGEPQKGRAHDGPLFMTAFDLRTLSQTSAGWDLLNATLIEHERLLWELEDLAKHTQPDSHIEISNQLNLVRTQILLFERLLIGERIDSLTVLVSHYAEIVGASRGESMEPAA